MGPTAVGKSALALLLAERFGAEIVSVDSRQVYRYLDIGTAKPSMEEQAAVPHHLIDLVNPDEPYSAVQFRADAEQALVDIKRRAKVAFLVGGTGHYFQALLDRLEIPPVPPHPEFRQQMESLAREQGGDTLFQRLRRVDPEAATFVAPTNIRRVIRALEVMEFSGVPFSELGRRRGEPVPALRIALTTERSHLHRLIDDRVEQQIRDGLFDEARHVLDLGFDPALPPLAGLVYREAISVVQERMSVSAAAKRMRETTHAYAKRQYTWFRRDQAISWLETGPGLELRAERLIADHIREHPVATAPHI